MLSGGIDSSVIAAVASEHVDSKVVVYTLGTPGSPDVESAKKTANMLKLAIG